MMSTPYWVHHLGDRLYLDTYQLIGPAHLKCKEQEVTLQSAYLKKNMQIPYTSDG